MGPSILRENRQLSDRPLSDQIKHIATFLIQPLLSGLPPLCIGHSPSVLHRFGWCLACFGGRNVGLISRIFRVWAILGWNGPVGLSFPCKQLLIVESLNIIACDWRFFLYTMYYHLCTVAPARRDSIPLLFLHKSLAVTSECQGVKTRVSRDPGRSKTVLRGHQDHYISWDTFVTSPTFWLWCGHGDIVLPVYSGLPTSVNSVRQRVIHVSNFPPTTWRHF